MLVFEDDLYFFVKLEPIPLDDNPDRLDLNGHNFVGMPNDLFKADGPQVVQPKIAPASKEADFMAAAVVEDGVLGAGAGRLWQGQLCEGVLVPDIDVAVAQLVVGLGAGAVLAGLEIALVAPEHEDVVQDQDAPEGPLGQGQLVLQAVPVVLAGGVVKHVVELAAVAPAAEDEHVALGQDQAAVLGPGLGPDALGLEPLPLPGLQVEPVQVVEVAALVVDPPEPPEHIREGGDAVLVVVRSHEAQGVPVPGVRRPDFALRVAGVLAQELVGRGGPLVALHRVDAGIVQPELVAVRAPEDQHRVRVFLGTDPAGLVLVPAQRLLAPRLFQLPAIAALLGLAAPQNEHLR
jgi:hypothetical protein